MLNHSFPKERNTERALYVTSASPCTISQTVGTILGEWHTMKIRTIIMETRASLSSLFLRESWPVLNMLMERGLIIVFTIQLRTSEQQQDNLPACCRLPCSDKIEGSREGQRQRQDDPREHRPMESGVMSTSWQRTWAFGIELTLT